MTAPDVSFTSPVTVPSVCAPTGAYTNTSRPNTRGRIRRMTELLLSKVPNSQTAGGSKNDLYRLVLKRFSVGRLPTAVKKISWEIQTPNYWIQMQFGWIAGVNT